MRWWFVATLLATGPVVAVLSSRFVDGPLPMAKTISWHAVGGAMGEKLQLLPGARWYPGIDAPVPLPRAIQEIPLEDRGVSIDFAAEKRGDVVSFHLGVKTLERPIVREIERRQPSQLPFLFAICDEHDLWATHDSDQFFVGGANGFESLADRGHAAQWMVDVSLESIRRLAPSLGRTVRLVAVFSERQHRPAKRVELAPLEPVLPAQWPTVTASKSTLVRSGYVRIQLDREE